MQRILLAGLVMVLVGAAEAANSDAKMLEGTWKCPEGASDCSQGWSGAVAKPPAAEPVDRIASVFCPGGAQERGPD